MLDSRLKMSGMTERGVCGHDRGGGGQGRVYGMRGKRKGAGFPIKDVGNDRGGIARE